MNTTDLRSELRGQADDRPEPAELLAALTRGRTVRRSRLAAVGLAAAVVAVISLGATLLSRPTPSHPALTASTPTSLPSTSSASTFELVCAGAIRVTAVPDSALTQVQGVVAIATGPQQVSVNTQQPGRYYDPAQQYFAKSGLQIKAGRAFRIQVPPTWRGRAEIGWSNVHVTPAEVLAVTACPRQRPAPTSTAGTTPGTGEPTDQWLTYPGGIWVSAPACVPLQIITATAITTVYIPVGKSCK